MRLVRLILATSALIYLTLAFSGCAQKEYVYVENECVQFDSIDMPDKLNFDTTYGLGRVNVWHEANRTTTDIYTRTHNGRSYSIINGAITSVDTLSDLTRVFYDMRMIIELHNNKVEANK
jgi:hypothetical protein